MSGLILWTMFIYYNENNVTLDVRWRDDIIPGGLLVAIAGLIRNVVFGSDRTLVALASLFFVYQWVLKDKTLFYDTYTYVSLGSFWFSDSYVSLRKSWRGDATIEPHPEESNSLENGDSESQLGTARQRLAFI